MATRNKVAAPNLLIVPKYYDWRYQEQLNTAQRLFYNIVSNALNASTPYGAFYSSNTLTNPTPNGVNLVPFDSSLDRAYNVTIGTVNTRVYAAETGVYNIQFSAQANVEAGGATGIINIWLRKNGQNVVASTGRVVVNGPDAETIASWNYVIQLQQGDYIELAWASAEGHLVLQAEPATDTIPSVPSVILTVVWTSFANISRGLS
jgi:hypothetical protein